MARFVSGHRIDAFAPMSNECALVRIQAGGAASGTYLTATEARALASALLDAANDAEPPAPTSGKAVRK